MEFIAKAQDSRCKYWCKISRAGDVLPDPAFVNGAGDLHGPYYKSGADIELEEGDIVFEGEEAHHAKQRGWVYTVAICVGDKLEYLAREDRAQAKDLWRLLGRKDLLAGSGDHAAMARLAHWLRHAPEQIAA